MVRTAWGGDGGSGQHGGTGGTGQCPWGLTSEGLRNQSSRNIPPRAKGHMASLGVLGRFPVSAPCPGVLPLPCILLLGPQAPPRLWPGEAAELWDPGALGGGVQGSARPRVAAPAPRPPCPCESWRGPGGHPLSLLYNVGVFHVLPTSPKKKTAFGELCLLEPGPVWVTAGVRTSLPGFPRWGCRSHSFRPVGAGALRTGVPRAMRPAPSAGPHRASL